MIAHQVSSMTGSLIIRISQGTLKIERSFLIAHLLKCPLPQICDLVYVCMSRLHPQEYVVFRDPPIVFKKNQLKAAATASPDNADPSWGLLHTQSIYL